MKYFLFIIASFTLLHAESYDNDVLTIFSKILPRIVLMSNQKKYVKESVNICIVHDKIDKSSASLLIDKIRKNYPQGIKSYAIKLSDYNYSDYQSCKDAHLLFLFNSSHKNIQQTLKYLKERPIISVSYDKRLLMEGVQISLFIGRKTTPYINIKTIQESGIKFENIFYRVSKLYYETDQ